MRSSTFVSTLCNKQKILCRYRRRRRFTKYESQERHRLFLLRIFWFFFVIPVERQDSPFHKVKAWKLGPFSTLRWVFTWLESNDRSAFLFRFEKSMAVLDGFSFCAVHIHAQRSFEKPGTSFPVIQRHIPEVIFSKTVWESQISQTKASVYPGFHKSTEPGNPPMFRILWHLK